MLIEALLTLSGASADPTESEQTSLKTAVADALSVDESALQGFTVTSTDIETRRRRLLAKVWTVAFSVSLSWSAQHASPAAAAGQIASALASPAFVSAVANVDSSLSVGSAETRSGGVLVFLGTTI